MNSDVSFNFIWLGIVVKFGKFVRFVCTSSYGWTFLPFFALKVICIMGNFTRLYFTGFHIMFCNFIHSYCVNQVLVGYTLQDFTLTFCNFILTYCVNQELVYHANFLLPQVITFSLFCSSQSVNNSSTNCGGEPPSKQVCVYILTVEYSLWFESTFKT